MEYYYFSLFLIYLFFILYISEINRNIKYVYKPFNRIGYCILLVVLFKFNFGINFYGLEYEDAYSFSFCARQFSYNIFPSSFLIDSISIGSLREPISTFTYGGHFITYPSFLSIITNIFGWSQNTLVISNLLISFCILLLLSFISPKAKYWYVAPTLYCCSPIINVFTTCFLSEIFSSLVCLTFIYSYLPDKKKNIPLSIVCFSLAILCKRENMILAIIPFLNLIFNKKATFATYKKRIFSIEFLEELVIYVSIILIYLSFIQNIFKIEQVESLDIMRSTFSIDYIYKLLPIFLQSFLRINSFSITFYIYFLYIIYNLYKKEHSIYNIYSISLGIAYLMLYTLHYRGYFFIKYEEIDIFETYRYINNFYYVIPLALANINIKKQHLKIPIALMLIFSFFSTLHNRQHLSTIENNERLREAHIVDTYIKNRDNKSILICENILVYQNICADDFNVCDITQINLLDLSNKEYEYYIVLPNLNYLKERYGITIDLERVPILQINNNKYLYKIIN